MQEREKQYPKFKTETGIQQKSSNTKGLLLDKKTKICACTYHTSTVYDHSYQTIK